jgi:DNA-binding NtrC family response regulator/tetratricopeptide (TPR) repeat protein
MERRDMEALADLIGESPAIAAVREKVRRLLQRQADSRRLPPVLIEGETGTGKGLLARILHRGGPRAAGPFVDINCAAIPETLLEAELFGFERGAFTDARQAKAGLFQTAHGGTLFLDEVGLLPEGLQAKLLKVIEDHAVRRLGSTRSEPVDVWIVAASESLGAALRARRFREDLYHRLAVVTITLPPLRERGGDILRLAEVFLARACGDYGLPPKAFAPEARAALLAYPWPGNLRELANVMERLTLLAEGPTVTPALLGLSRAAAPAEPRSRAEAPGPREPGRAIEPERLRAALQGAGWNVSRAAVRLGMSRNTLRYWVEKHGLRPEPATPAAPPEPPGVSGAPAAPAGRLAPAAPAGAGGERRQVTLFRADVVAPPDAAAGDVGRALDALADKVQSFGGRVEEIGPESLEAAFGVEPVEDAPLRAAHAAVAVLNAAERARRAGVAPLAVTVALHAGQFLVEQAGGAAELAQEARRQAAAVLEALVRHAEPGTVLVSGAAASFLERRFELEPVRLPAGPAGPAYRLAGRERPGAGPRRRLATFVGRRHELELLQSRLASAMSGRGQVVGIAGEAGIGKTRLLLEVRQSLPGDRVTYLEGHCVPYGDAIPYLPLLHLVRNNCAIAETDPPEAIVEKVRIAVRAVGLDPDEAGPYLLQLLGVKEGTARLARLSPEAIKGRTFETLRQMALKASRQRPLVLAVENLHWIDRTSEEYLASLVESLAGAPILLLLTYRPGYRPPGMEKSYATQIGLQPLAAPDSLSLVRSFLAAPELPETLTEPVLAKAEGNPFFLEELALAVWEGGAAEDPLAAVPDTIQEALMARIDRLPDEPRRVLQTASVLGREVSLRLLGAIWPGPGGLDPHLVELKRLEFLYEQSGADEPVYVFKHALTQEVAYRSLAPARRRALHAAAGRMLETLFADRLTEVYDRLAHHYARTDDSRKAIDYLTRAAEKAARHYAHAEAVRALEEVRRHAERLPAEARDPTVLGAVLRQAHSLYFLGRFPESLESLVAQAERVDRLRDPALSGPYHFWLGYTESHLGDYATADRHARRALDEATRCGDRATQGRACYLLARGGFWSGCFREGVEHARNAIALLQGSDEPWWLGAAHWGAAFNHGFLGEFGPALAAARDADAVGRAIGDPRLQAYAAWTTGWLRAAMGEHDAGIAACQRSLDHSPDPVNTADAMSFLGYAHVARGAAAPAIPLLTQAVRQWSRSQHRPMLGWFSAVLAEAHLLDGQLETARALASEATTVATGAGFRYGIGVARRARGRVARAAGELAGAEAELRAALETFAAIEARHDAACTRLDLAAVAHARGDVAGAAAQLGDARRTFAALGVPAWEARAADLARRLGVPLTPGGIS